MLVGVDIGGTFTDLILSDDGRLQIHKVLSTPHDPSQAMLAGLVAMSRNSLHAIARVSHGSTVATNAMLERKGVPTALITTRGFRDILAIGRQNRPVLYALQPQLPSPLIPRRWCYEVDERLDHNGAILTPLNSADLDRVLDDIVSQRIESVAICFLYSYVNPVHEQVARARILERGLLQKWQVVLSSEVLPEFREYERASTTVLEAYVRPVVGQYLSRLEEELPASCSLRIIKSDGGVVSSQRARRQAVQTVLSGPAAGVIGSFYLAQRAGYDRVITFDMGGTSTDVGLCPGELVRRAESSIDGLPLRTRLLDIESIGAGGGSIARLDSGGALCVGPESAGADPGPIAYVRGGRQVTVTDANATLGRLNPQHFLGGDMPLYLEPARAALESLGNQMGLDTEATALGIIDFANVNIDRALRRVSISRGYDPRDFTLVAFGGAGPMHACAVAAKLGIPRVLIPRYPGVLCAFGLLVTDIVLEIRRSVLGLVTAETPACLLTQLDEMVGQARSDLFREGIAEEAMVFEGLVDVRYQGQSHELTIPLTQDFLPAFHIAHTRAYGHAMPDRPVEVVNLHLQATGLVERPTMEPEELAKDDGREALLGEKPGVCEETGLVQFALYDRERLRPGTVFAGPSLVFQKDCTVYIAPQWSARVDGYRNIVLELS